MNGSSREYPSATSLARAIRRRELSVEDASGTHLERLRTLNPVLNSILQVAPDFRRYAGTRRRSGPRRRRGRWPAVRGSVHREGCLRRPAARLADHRATGMAERPDPVADHGGHRGPPAPGGGAILIGVTRRRSGATGNSGMARHNPYDLERTPGGSSGGEAATVAAGGSPLGLGQRLRRQPRAPAHFCGIATLRPSNGRVPRGRRGRHERPADRGGPPGPLGGRSRGGDCGHQRLRLGDPTTLPAAAGRLPPGSEPEGLRVAFIPTTASCRRPPRKRRRPSWPPPGRWRTRGRSWNKPRHPDLDEAWEITMEYWRYCGETGTVADYFAFLDRWDRYRVRLGLDGGVRSAPLSRGGAPGPPGGEKTMPLLGSRTQCRSAWSAGRAPWSGRVRRPKECPSAFSSLARHGVTMWRWRARRASKAALGGWQPPPFGI